MSDIDKFFDDLERVHSEGDRDPSEMAEREKELGITQADWRRYEEKREVFEF